MFEGIHLVAAEFVLAPQMLLSFQDDFAVLYSPSDHDTPTRVQVSDTNLMLA